MISVNSYHMKKSVKRDLAALLGLIISLTSAIDSYYKSVKILTRNLSKV